MATGDEIKAMKKAIQEQEPYKQTDCPECGSLILLYDTIVLGSKSKLGGKVRLKYLQ